MYSSGLIPEIRLVKGEKMETEALNCRCCGGVLKVESNLCQCTYCGATNFISNVAGKYINQLNRANKLRQAREFDNAARIYDNILEENVATPDILWYRTLCEYGIEYVPDPISDKYIPTLHRVKEESILEYHCYTEALQLATPEHKESLEKEAEYINKIQIDYLNIARNEKPYDVFICYKETDDATGEKTEDVALAQQLFLDLSSRGFKVFFAKITLQSKLSIDYEPYIFAALKSAKAMVVLGTKAEYFMSVWVKNEWGRFLKMMQDDLTKQMFFACDDPDELPRAFVTKQAQILGEEGAIRNLADNVERFLRKRITKKQSLPETNKVERVRTVEEMYEDALQSVRAREHIKAARTIDVILSKEPESAKTFWLKMLNGLKSTPSNIVQLKIDLAQNPDFVKAIDYADEDLKNEYLEIAKICKRNMEEQIEFDSLLESESIRYVNEFDKTEFGQEAIKEKENIKKLAGKVDANNFYLRCTFVIGTILFFIGNVIAIIMLKNGMESGASPYKVIPLSVLVTAPIIVFGTAILFSYNIIMDIIISAIVFVMMILSAVFPENSDFFRFITVVLPAIVYMGSNNSFKLNRIRYKILKNTIEIKNSLDKLKRITENAASDMSRFASKLLQEFKANKKIEQNIIEIHDDDYYIGQNKLTGIYKNTEAYYESLINMTLPGEQGGRADRTESEYGIIALVMSFIPGLDVIGLAIALFDIFKDKYRKHTHITAVASLLLDVLVLIAGYLILIDF